MRLRLLMLAILAASCEYALDSMWATESYDDVHVQVLFHNNVFDIGHYLSNFFDWQRISALINYYNLTTYLIIITI